MNGHSPLRVGYVVKMFPRISETFILNELLELERQGVEVVIFSAKKPNEGRFHPQLSRLRAKVFYLEDLDLKKWAHWISREWGSLATHSDRLWREVGAALAAGEVARVDLVWQAAWIAARAKDLDLDHLHAHFASLPSTLAHLVGRISGISYTFTAHAKDIYVYTNNEHLLDEKIHQAARVITVTEYNRSYFHSVYPDLRRDQVTVINNGIDLQRFKPDADAQREDHLILAVGRLVPKKGFHVLLDALARLKADGAPFRCRLVGDGSERDALEAQAAGLGLNSEVSFDGALHSDQVLDLMQRATLLALPCVVAEDGNVDALPTVLLEAMACGLPVVSTTVSGIPEIVDHQVDGLLSKPDDPVGLASQMTRLLQDAALRARYAQAARSKVEQRFNLVRNAGKLRDVFADVIELRARSVNAGTLDALTGVHHER